MFSGQQVSDAQLTPYTRNFLAEIFCKTQRGITQLGGAAANLWPTTFSTGAR